MKNLTELMSRLMRGLPLSISDAIRLCLEMCEELAITRFTMEREELLRRLRRLIRRGADCIRREERTVSFEAAAWASVKARDGRRKATRSDLRHFVRRMLRVEGFAERPLRSMTSDSCRDLLQTAFGSSIHSYRKGRAILHSIFAYGFRREWCDSNPVDRIESPEVHEKEIIPLRPEEIRRLFNTAALPEFREFRLPLYLMLYCGIRPTELTRINVERDINWKEKTIAIRPICSKTGGGRVIPLRCAHGLPHDMKHIPLSRWRVFRRRAGFRRWVPDVLRHTFASYHAAYFRNFSALQVELGHRDSSLLRTRYVNAAYVSKREAAEFWQGAYQR